MKKKVIAMLLSFTLMISGISIKNVTTTKAASYGLSNPVVTGTGDNKISTWDTIYFGNYYQSNSTTKEPIRWRVLSVEGDEAFLLADQNLDCQPYNTEYKSVTWETCTLRSWLNSDFLNTAFSSSEQSAIKTTTVVNDDNPYWGTEGGNNTYDKVCLLSIDEARNSSYGFNSDFRADTETRYAKNTRYAKDRGAYTSSYSPTTGNGWWWLRSPGDDSGGAADVYYVGYGDSHGYDVDDDVIAIRPALRISLSSSSWTKGGKVSARWGEGSGEEETTVDEPTTTEPEETTYDEPTTTEPEETPYDEPTTTEQKETEIVQTIDNTNIAETTKKVINNNTTIVKKLIAKKKSLKVSWNKVKNINGYKLQYSLNKQFKKAKTITIKKVSATSFTIKKLKSKKKYYIRIRTYKIVNGKTYYSVWSKAKSKKTK